MPPPNVIAERISQRVHTELGRVSLTSAGVRLRFAGVSHRLELAQDSGHFSQGIGGQVDLALSMFFSEALAGLTDEQRAFFQATVVKLIRERHEHQLPKPPDPRRLPLTLPQFGQRTHSPWAPRRKALAAEARA